MRRANLVVSAALLLICGGAPAAWGGEGVVALQTADPSCPDDSGNIYVDCGNGTVTDNRTGLVWLKNANCIGTNGGGDGDPIGRVNFQTALEFVAGLSDKPGTSIASAADCGLSDGSSPGEWRLPSVEEWEAMVADAMTLGCADTPTPTLTNDSGSACWVAGPSSFDNVAASFYWSSSADVADPASAWDIFLEDASFSTPGKHLTDLVWPVRGGQ